VHDVKEVGRMGMWVLWLVLAVVLGVAEIATLTAALGLLGGAALITALAAAVGLPVVLQLLVFAAASAAGLVLLRPIAQRYMLAARAESSARFGVEALVGRNGQVLAEVSGRGGRVRIDGDEWTARPYDEALVIPAGTIVSVLEIQGATALVHPSG
jgi:membrane protein implicated in regulation of membrane protease activity